MPKFWQILVLRNEINYKAPSSLNHNNTKVKMHCPIIASHGADVCNLEGGTPRKSREYVYM